MARSQATKRREENTREETLPRRVGVRRVENMGAGREYLALSQRELPYQKDDDRSKTQKAYTKILIKLLTKLTRAFT